MDLSPDEDHFEGRLLHQAALWDNLELLQELLTAGAAAGARDARGRTALHAAALAPRSRCLRALLAAGADPDAACDLGQTALHITAARGHAENASLLLTAGASSARPDRAGDTPLALAEAGEHRLTAQLIRAAMDAEERERIYQHTELRTLVSTGSVAALKAKLAALGPAAGLLVNMTPAGANTLLYVASENGLTSSASALLAAGADGRAHPVTRYCPLYTACYHGHADTARLLLEHFPAAAQQETVERWLPLHAACIGGHPALVTLLLQYPYPEHVLHVYTDPSGEWEYKFPFDVNAVDASGQSALYVACTLGNTAVAGALLRHTVAASRAGGTQPEEVRSPSEPARRGISLGIQAIVSKLTGGGKNEQPQETDRLIRIVRTDIPRGTDSCVACAVRGGHQPLLKVLLDAGADPNAPAAPPQQHPLSGEDRRARSVSCGPRRGASPAPMRYDPDREAPWTALALAARLRHVRLAEMLLRRGAADPRGRALAEAARQGLPDLVRDILATRASIDTEGKVNISGVWSVAAKAGGGELAAQPAALDWRQLRAELGMLRVQWLIAAAQRINPSSSPALALHALTRLDVASNELTLLPRELFGLVSLRYLNAAQNKLERLPSPSDPLYEDQEGKGRKNKKNVKCLKEVYTAPVLTELYLQDNRLEELPPALFTLPTLSTLDVSNNKLRTLPAAMWAAPALQDLNASLNLLADLPYPEKCSEDEYSSEPPSPATPVPPPNELADSRTSSRSPSIERSESERDDDLPIPNLSGRAAHTMSAPLPRVHPWRGAVEAEAPAVAPPGPGGGLSSLALAHNRIASVPAALACGAPGLRRLSLAHNGLRSMAHVTAYPAALRHLDLSHNSIACWPSLPQLDGVPTTEDPLRCYCPRGARPKGGSSVGGPNTGGVRAQLLAAACPARRHLRLEALRTLILSNNLLPRIQLTTDDDGEEPPPPPPPDHDDDWDPSTSLRSRLLFPQLSMLDVSCNLLRRVPTHIHLLTHLAVFNLSGNKEITELPPQMGLLTRLWNLNTTGCNLGEPLRGMLASGRYKSMDVVGYLRGVLTCARRYARCKLMVVGAQGIGKTSLLECLRQESALHHRRKNTDHWSKRMGNKSSKRLSTVGVDIGAWVYERARGGRGAVTFRTWDFGGQQEYYATHQYFLSRRALYLVAWKVTDGRRGLHSALMWLRSIQARAPGAPVILVATHYDQVANSSLSEEESPEALQRVIRTRLLAAPDADKLGLPRVMDSLEVSCSSRHNIRLLADIIYTCAFSIKPPGSKQPMLEQLVPAWYLSLEEAVTALATDHPEPVVKHHEYKRLVNEWMAAKGVRGARDAAELHQATVFLHENGVLLHYDDATLKELVFLRPQWLCDLLAHVITVREVNPFANNGIMKMSDLQHVFKASPALGGEEASALGAALLTKFELALPWEQRLLVVPPLLPVHEPREPQLPLRCRGASRSEASLLDGTPLSIEPAGGRALLRLVSLSYVPSGFWARLATRLLADPALTKAARALYTPTEELGAQWSCPWGWRVWRYGATLCCSGGSDTAGGNGVNSAPGVNCAAGVPGGGLVALSVRELPCRRDPLLAVPCDAAPHPLYRDLKIRVQQEGGWCELDVEASTCVEILLPAQACVLRRRDGLTIHGYQSITLEPSQAAGARLLALAADHVDQLLEDWYPSLGTRFVHTSEGRSLITRVVPCGGCLRDLAAQRDQGDDQAIEVVEENRGSEDSRSSTRDSGVGRDSSGSWRSEAPHRLCHGWSVEQCILMACTGAQPRCDAHPNQQLRHLAPDLLLLDIEEVQRVRWCEVVAGSVAGRGAFGTVVAARWRGTAVAVKLLQPARGKEVEAPVSAAAACRSYLALRGELAVLRDARHPHVVGLVGVCAAPLALVLPLAPGGALSTALRGYRAAGARVGVRAARALALQLAKALEYLHARRVLYRDLKSENVLVWSLPRPGEAAAAERSPAPVPVHIKLGDYGISRLAPPTGTKGFGGTEGFMAPEIMRYNGEEEYNEKVDCFSFGMLLYEVIALRPPYAGLEGVKDAVLDGARPALTHRELQSPVNVLETMRRCWSAAAPARPSAAALVSAAAAPEYIALQDAAVAPTPPPPPPGRAEPPPPPGFVAAATGVQLIQDGSPGWEVWWGGGGARLSAAGATQYEFTQHHQLRQTYDKADPVDITAIARVGNKIWVGDADGGICVYSASSSALCWRVSVCSAVGGAVGAARALLPLPAARRVAVATDSGRLFLVSWSRPEAEGSFVLTELGTANALACLAAVNTSNGQELWAGGDSLTAYSITASGVSGADPLPATGLRLLAADTLPCVLAYSYPGVSISLWCARTRRETARLDCSKLAPCSESLQSIGIDDDDPKLDRGRVVSLCVWGGVGAAGTAWGCLLLVSLPALTPLTAFRPYEADISCLVPLKGHSGAETRLATLGRGYRPLLHRLVPLPPGSQCTPPPPDAHYWLLWRADRWLPD